MTRLRRSRWARTPRWARNWVLVWHRLTRRLGLAQRFLIGAVAIIAVSTALLGFIAGRIVESSILSGIAHTANSSVQALIYPTVKDIAFDIEVNDAERASLDQVFAVSQAGSATRLLQFVLLRLDGSPLYEADG